MVNATVDGDTASLDKTWQEIAGASFPVIVIPDGSGGVTWNTIRSTYLDNGVYKVSMVVGNVGEGNSLSYVFAEFTTNSASGYPVASGG